MIYKVDNFCIFHPATGEMLRPGDTFECEPSELRPNWTDPAWLALACVPYVVQEQRPATAPKKSADPLPAVPSVDDSKEIPAGGEGGDRVWTPAELADMTAAELRTVADSIGLAYGKRPRAKSLAARILNAQG